MTSTTIRRSLVGLAALAAGATMAIAPSASAASVHPNSHKNGPGVVTVHPNIHGTGAGPVRIHPTKRI